MLITPETTWPNQILLIRKKLTFTSHTRLHLTMSQNARGQKRKSYRSEVDKTQCRRLSSVVKQLQFNAVIWFNLAQNLHAHFINLLIERRLISTHSENHQHTKMSSEQYRATTDLRGSTQLRFLFCVDTAKANENVSPPRSTKF